MSALQLQIRPPLMRSCPSDPEEEEDGGGYPGVPLTQPMRGGGGGGGSSGRSTQGQRSPVCSLATYDDVLRQRRWHRRGLY